jgi:hypothetical protein
MSESENHKVLALLAREWDLKGPPGILDISDTLAALKALFENGLVDMNEPGTVAYLTPEGYDAAERGGDC